MIFLSVMTPFYYEMLLIKHMCMSNVTIEVSTVMLLKYQILLLNIYFFDL